MPEAFLNRIATAVPAHDVHVRFTAFAPSLLSERDAALFRRMAARGQIDHRYSVLSAGSGDTLDGDDFYRPENFPTTAARMQAYRVHALPLAQRAVEDLLAPDERAGITHLLITSCTGFYAPGLDFDLIAACGLDSSIERTLIGFMGCYAAVNALKLARHIVRGEPAARVLIVNIELCTLHLQQTDDLEKVLSFYLFGDGCAASLVTAEAVGARLDGFHAAVAPDSAGMITWHIGDAGFDMVLSGAVPQAVGALLPVALPVLLDGTMVDDIEHWAIHPGGRSVLDAVETSLALGESALADSRAVLRDYGNMSSATVMFVLQKMLAVGRPGTGVLLAFGPGVTAEGGRFTIL